MSDWITPLQRHIDRELATRTEWCARTGIRRLREARVHLAIVREPYLSLIVSGDKTIESRFSLHDRAPYERVMPGDLLVLKEPAGPVHAIAQVRRPWFFRRDTTWEKVRKQFGAAMCATDDEFWATRAATNYATLLRLQHVLVLPTITCDKKDRRAWVLLSKPSLW